MRIFNFEKEYSKLLTPDSVSYLVQIHEYKGAYANGKIAIDKGMPIEQLQKLLGHHMKNYQRIS